MTNNKPSSPNQDPVAQVFRETCDGYSADRVIADPELNARFIASCRARGLQEPPVELNRKLLNTRKRAGLPRSIHRTAPRNQDAFAFAAEIAIRSLERKYGTTLDRVLCDPELATEFDGVATAIAPGFTSLEYRWAALGLRKTNRLKPEILGRVVQGTVYGPVSATDLDVAKIPRDQGLYILTARERVLYVGEAKDLRSRLKKHFDHSDNKLLAQYLWAAGRDNLLVEYHVLPPSTATKVRKAMELELIRSRRAEFNKQR
jgi:site-specific DNA-methyltransferase (adenine-specific)